MFLCVLPAGSNPGWTDMDQFDAFFRRADLDGDGRISGAEAVAFFQGSNLPKNVLAQVPFSALYSLSHSFLFGFRMGYLS